MTGIVERIACSAIEAGYRHEDLEQASAELFGRPMAAKMWRRVRDLARARNRAAWEVEMRTRYFQGYGVKTEDGWKIYAKRLGIKT